MDNIKFDYTATSIQNGQLVVLDSIHARNFLDSLLERNYVLEGFCTYLVIDVEKKTWRTSFDFEWLYFNKPPITDLQEIKNILSC